MSLPTRGAWIEISIAVVTAIAFGRSPRGERGLKSNRDKVHSQLHKSLPTRGAWIEIVSGQRNGGRNRVAPHAGSVD